MLCDIKFNDGQYYSKVSADITEDQIELSFPYNANLLNEVKSRFENRKFDWDKKTWTFPTSQRNIFQFEVLKGKYGCKPYSKWDKKKEYSEDIKAFCAERAAKILNPFNHQVSMVNQSLNVGWFIWAAEMGTGKTLAAIILMEMSGITDWIWVGPKAPLVAVQLEFMKWKSWIRPTFVTYDGLKKLVEQWPIGKTAPKGLMLDEISRCKTAATQRTIAAKHLADSIRRDHGTECIIGGLSGSPAPKNPGDWWSICEVVAPGFIREANIHLFRQRLGILQERETVAGAGKYNHLVGWKDDENKCDICNQFKDHPNHTTDFMTAVKASQTYERHDFKPSVNEVAKLAKRLQGLVGVWLKKDCLDLPAKRYEVITVKPSRSLLNAAKLITETSTRAVETLTRLRTLSDGFQYKEVKIGTEDCHVCCGKKEILEWKAVNAVGDKVAITVEEAEEKNIYLWDEDENGVEYIKERFNCEPEQELITCPRCDGEGTIDALERQLAEVECGKDQVLKDVLERHEEGGRLNIFAGFTGSIERVEKICHKEGWHVLRVDGRGWSLTDVKGVKIDKPAPELLQIYQEGQEEYPQVVFLGQPGAGGMGLTLTASPTTLFFSNDFNFESRIQAEDRHHRPGMLDHGGLIIDIVHLPTDLFVLDNLKKKRDLQKLSMTGIKESMEEQAC